MEARLVRIGNSKGIRFPKPLLQEASLRMKSSFKQNWAGVSGQRWRNSASVRPMSRGVRAHETKAIGNYRFLLLNRGISEVNKNIGQGESRMVDRQVLREPLDRGKYVAPCHPLPKAMSAGPQGSRETLVRIRR